LYINSSSSSSSSSSYLVLATQFLRVDAFRTEPFAISLAIEISG
jgi:hypothetical protein